MSSLAKAWETGLPVGEEVRELQSMKWSDNSRLTLLALVVLEHLHGGEGSTTGEQLMAELGLVVRLVGLLVVVTGLA